MDYKELCVKHGVRVVCDVSSGYDLVTVYRVQRRWLGVFWTRRTYDSETKAREAAKTYANSLENKGRVVWP